MANMFEIAGKMVCPNCDNSNDFNFKKANVSYSDLRPEAAQVSWAGECDYCQKGYELKIRMKIWK